jgi:hypothetical protein
MKVEERIKCKDKRAQVVNAILSLKKKVGGITLPDLEIYYKEILIKSSWPRHKSKY